MRLDCAFAGPPGSSGYCSGKCCPGATDVCVVDSGSGDGACCAYNRMPVQWPAQLTTRRCETIYLYTTCSKRGASFAF